MTQIIIKTVEDRLENQAIKTIRRQVFQVEQGISEELEFDGWDESATHLIAYLDHQPVGTTRIRPLNDKTVKIERLSVLPLARGKGIGKQLMLEALEIAIERNYHTALIHAQQYLKSFYEQLGFEPIGNTFEEANIPHLKMIKKLSNITNFE